MSKGRPPPAFTGLAVHREPRYRCSLLIPDGWRKLPLESERGEGVVWRPDREDEATSFSLEGRDLGLVVGPRDLRALRSGFVKGLRQLPDCALELEEAEAVGQLITMEARLTFREGEARRQRWIRLLYHDRVQLRLIAQGSSPEQFEHWEPMFYHVMRTLRLGDWWAEVIGVDWAETAFNEDAGTAEPRP